MSNKLHSTTQAREQGQDPGPPPDEHPHDLLSRPNDAHNQHRTAETGLDGVDYPPQLHAGKVGLGPHYGEQNRPTIGEQFQGFKEELKGKWTHDQYLQEEGHDRITGEFKRNQHAKENGFDKPGGATKQTNMTEEGEGKTVQQAPSSPPVATAGTK